MVEQVNVLHRQPLYAFSGLTLQVSLFWILFANLSFLGQALQPTVSSTQFAIEMTSSILIIGLAVLTFVLPHWGIHRKLAEAKLEIQEETSIQIDETQRNLFAALTNGNYKQASELDGAMSSLYRVHEKLQSIPTWPWPPGMIRSFLSAIFLPMLLWIIQEFVSRTL